MNMKNNIPNPWDILSQSKFNINLPKDKIDPRAADNILIAWPPILKLINQYYPNPNGIKVMDFGCGNSGFCQKLYSLGFEVTGLDSSAEMIKGARDNSSHNINYIIGNQRDLPAFGKYDIITSIMTFPFIDEIQITLKLISDVLNKNGLLIFADFNNICVKECLQNRTTFSDFDSITIPSSGMKLFGDIKIPVFIRESKNYDLMTKKLKLLKIFEDRPPFTKEFIEKYPDIRPKKVSEYLILGYKKF